MNANYAVEQVVNLTLAKFGTELNSGSIAKAVNAALLVLDVKVTKVVEGKEVTEVYQVTPQMMNNYGRQGMLDGRGKRDSMEGVVFSVDTIRTWMTKFLTNKVNGIVSRNSGVQAKDVAELVRAELNKPNTVIVDDDKPAQAAPAAKAAQPAKANK